VIDLPRRYRSGRAPRAPEALLAWVDRVAGGLSVEFHPARST